jgi:hypothetical protein
MVLNKEGKIRSLMPPDAGTCFAFYSRYMAM